MNKIEFFDLMDALQIGGYSDDTVLYKVEEGHTYETFFGEGAQAINRVSANMQTGRCVVVYQRTMQEIWDLLDFVEDETKSKFNYIRVRLHYGDNFAIVFYVD